jgi:hypothetical protein
MSACINPSFKQELKQQREITYQQIIELEQKILYPAYIKTYQQKIEHINKIWEIRDVLEQEERILYPAYMKMLETVCLNPDLSNEDKFENCFKLHTCYDNISQYYVNKIAECGNIIQKYEDELFNESKV